MTNLKRTAAIFAAVASIAAVAAAPASAQTVDLDGAIAYNPCVDDPEPSTCVNWAADVANRTVQYAWATYYGTVQPWVDYAACEAYDVISSEECP